MQKWKLVSAVAGVAAALTLTTGGVAGAIVGGDLVNSAPWGAQIFWNDAGFKCSGTIIAPQWVLTARHCMHESGVTVKVGSVNLNQGEAAGVDRQIPAPRGDIALLHLDRGINTAYMKVSNTSDPTPGEVDSIYGWGRTQDDSPPSPVLKTAKVQVIEPGTDPSDGSTLIGSKGIDGSVWFGDDGGPQIARGVQVGVESGGGNGHDAQSVNLYASLTESRGWIYQVAGV